MNTSIKANTVKLTDQSIKAIRVVEKAQKFADEKGLYLYVTPTGLKSWRYDYRSNGKRVTVTFGRYPKVSLVAARRKHLDARAGTCERLDKDMRWHGGARGKRGRSPKYSEAAIQFCLTVKSLFNLPLRQAMGMTQSPLGLVGLDWLVPDFSIVSRRQKHLAVTIGAHATTTGLHLLVDSTGIKMLGEGEWKTKMHGANYRRQWRKVHLGIDAATLEIRAIEVTDNATGDAPMLPCLLDQIGDDEPMASVSGDGAYDTKGCHEAIARRGADAIIPTRRNAKPWKDRRPGAEARNAILDATRRLGRKIWKKWTGYHRRSLVETKMRCFKLLGERVMARDFDRQVAELRVRATILNRFTRLGAPRTVAMP